MFTLSVWIEMVTQRTLAPRGRLSMCHQSFMVLDQQGPSPAAESQTQTVSPAQSEQARAWSVHVPGACTTFAALLGLAVCTGIGSNRSFCLSPRVLPQPG